MSFSGKVSVSSKTVWFLSLNVVKVKVCEPKGVIRHLGKYAYLLMRLKQLTAPWQKKKVLNTTPCKSLNLVKLVVFHWNVSLICTVFVRIQQTRFNVFLGEFCYLRTEPGWPGLPCFQINKYQALPLMILSYHWLHKFRYKVRYYLFEHRNFLWLSGLFTQSHHISLIHYYAT